MSGHTATPGEPIGWIVRIKDVKCFYWERGVAEWKAGEFEDQHGATATIDPVFLADSHADLVRALEDLDAVLDFSDENLEPVWTFDDLTAVRAAFKQATAALATLTARKVG